MVGPEKLSRGARGRSRVTLPAGARIRPPLSLPKRALKRLVLVMLDLIQAFDDIGD